MKNIAMVIVLLMLSVIATAQVTFDLSYSADTKVYTVSVVPQATWDAPKNMIGSAQVVLRVASDKEFTPAITTLVDGLIWADNAYVENPDGGNGYTFVCISIVNPPTSKIKLVSGERIPLFSFVNAGGGCAGEVSLPENNDPMIKAVRAGGYNVTQHLAVLGAGGNAFLGLENGTVDCSASTGVPEITEGVIAEVKLLPVPADKVVTLEWNLLSNQYDNLEIVFCDAQGRETHREKAGSDQGRHSRQVHVDSWPAGLYRVRFVADRGYQTRSWNMMVIH